MIKRNKLKNGGSLIDLLLILTIFLFAIDFLNKSNYIILILLVNFSIWMLTKKRYLYIRYELIILSICFTLYFLIYKIYTPISLQSFIVIWIGPIIAYVVGYHICGETNGIKIKNVLLILAFGTFIHGALNMILFFRKGMDGRHIPDIWSGIAMTATLQGVLFTMICSLVFYSIFIEKNFGLKLMIIGCILFSIYSTTQTASRSLLVIVAIVFMINTILYLYINRYNKKIVKKFLINIVLLIITVFAIYNIFDFESMYQHSPLYKRVHSEYETELDKDPRFEMYETVIDEMFQYPLGGNKIQGSLKYAHNLWLDTVIDVGILPFFILVIYTIMTLITIIKFIKHNGIKKEDKYIVLSIYSSLLLNFAVEPILQGIPYIFIDMCIINGMTKRVLDQTIYLERASKV